MEETANRLPEHGMFNATLVSVRERLVLGCAAALALGAEVVDWSIETDPSWLVFSMSIGAVVMGGRPTLKKGFIALRTFTLNINFLMSIAVLGAFGIGEFAEAAVVVTLFAVAELIEKYSIDRARNAVRALMDLAPESAFVKTPDGGWIESPAAKVSNVN
jgi:Cd2+/Zn2+-exporting ATPase